jgi:hypothetical protein
LDDGILPSVVDTRGNESPFYMDLLYTMKNRCAKRALIFLIMLLSTEVLLDHIVDYLLFLSDTPSFWFTLNTS